MADFDLDQYLAAAKPKESDDSGPPFDLDAFLSAQNPVITEAEAKTRWGSMPAMLGQAAAGTVQDIVGAPGTIWSAANKLMPKGSGATINIPTRPGFMMTGSEIGKKTGLGLSQHSELTPVTPTERYGVAATQGAVGALPMLATGGAAIPTLLTGAAGGVASEAADQLSPGSTALQLGAGLLTGTTAQGVESLLAGNRIEKIASSFGQSRTLQEAGQSLQDEAKAWRTNVMPTKQAALSVPLDLRVPGDAPVKLSNYKGILDDINTRAGDLQNSADVLTPAGARRLQNALQLRDEAMALAGKGPGEPTTWENARALRSLIGEAKSDPMLVKDIGKKNMDALYSGITQDLGNTAELLGSKDLWDTYNTESTKLYNFAEDKLSKVISTGAAGPDPLIKPEDAAAKLISGAKRGATDLAAIKSELPQGVNELTAAHLRSPTAWKNLSPEAKRTMIPDEAVRRELDRRMPQVVSPLTATQNLLSLGIGSQIGGAAVPLALNALSSHVGADTAHNIGNVLGTVTPLLYHGGKAIVRNPSLLRLPLAGAMGANSLNLGGSEPQQK